MRFAFIQRHRKQWPLPVMCRVLGVTRQGYITWHKRQRGRQTNPSGRQQEDARLLLRIQSIHHQHRQVYGSPRVHRVLVGQGVRVGRKRVARLMRQAGLRGVCRGRFVPRTTLSNHRYPVAHNLLERRFAPQEVGGLNRAWCGDITYLPTQEGWLYLATVKDLFSRRIVGWAVADTLESDLVVRAWQRALQTRGFTAQQGPELYHSDRGSQYCGLWFQSVLAQSSTQSSMSARGECLDNAVAESFFGTLKAELLAAQPGRRFASKAQATTLVSDYIENFYNRMRLHSTLGYRSPVAFELAHQAGQNPLFQ